MSAPISPQPATRRLDQNDWRARVLVSDDSEFPVDLAVTALVEVLEVAIERALALCRLIERFGEFPVWRGTPEGAEHTAARLRARGLVVRVR